MRCLIPLSLLLLLLLIGGQSRGQTTTRGTTSPLPTTTTTTPLPTTTATPSADFDPCFSYTDIDDYWRNIRSSSYSGYDDTVPEWNGWYRLYLNGAKAQLSEWCVSSMTCGGYSPLVLGGSHPKLEDGIVTREIHAFSGGQCNLVNTSNPVQVKACPGQYYVYKLIKPDVSIPMPTYCAVSYTNPNNDPCHDYTVLDQPWRSTNNSNYYNYYGYYWWYWWAWCDSYTSWNGWYRLIYQGNDIRMPESCVREGMCGTDAALWLNGPHPEQNEGVVTRQVCGSWSGACCYFKSFPIQVKACPGNYYIYEFVSPVSCTSAYCADVDSISSPENSTGAFYPFGDGDVINQQSDDGSSGAIMLHSPFIYFGKTHNQIFVNNNGHLTFDQAWSQFVPYQFPANGGRDIIAPFWTDLDNTGRGVISYQQYTSGNVLTQATQDINQYFPQLNFNASWVFVATWYSVAYLSQTNTETSFQVVLISDGNLSFLLMNYGVISPSNRNVEAGYDTDDSSYYFLIPGSFQYNYTSFTYSSNVNITGRWAFRVDEGSQTCEFNGNTVPFGTSFGKDNSCLEICTCTRRGLQCNLEPCTFAQACRPAALLYSCQNIQRQTCTISGDQHYYTFDNQVFHFQGTCTYVLSEACSEGLPYYRIEGKNEHQGSTYVSWTRLVRVVVYDTELELVKDHPYEAKVNGTFAATPFSLQNGSIQVYQSGFSVIISTAFGLVVTYNAYSYVTISVPYDYQNATCGLCGNFNHHAEDDFRTRSGEIMDSDIDFANSWMAFGGTDDSCQVRQCSGLTCAHCSSDQSHLYSTSDYCGILSEENGPFSTCHTTLSPTIFRENCVHDLCVGDGYQPILCQALNVYAAQCQQQGINLGQWRRPRFCEIPCQANSHFESQGTGCPVTCSDPTAPLNCPLPSQESCICNQDYVLSAGECVPQSNCGCTFEELYYAGGQTVILDDDCGRQCTCSNGVMSCQNHQCGPQEMCGFYNGVRGCRPTSYSTCLVEGQSTYNTFDGLRFHYPGACELTLSRVMGLAHLPNFAVSVKKVPNGSQDFSRLMRFEAEGTQVSIKMGEGGRAEVDGQDVALPFSVGNGRFLIYHSSVKGIIMETSFGVTVRADWPHLIRITAPSTYSGILGGLCGNFNGNHDDEFYSPVGVLLNNTKEFGDSWWDGSLSGHCVESEVLGEQRYYRDTSQLNQHCIAMASSDGPFAQCHSILDFKEWVADCTRYLEQTGHAKKAFCGVLRGYAVLCQQNGVQVEEWRNITNCEFPCPANSHYDVCGTSCPSACPSLSFPFPCTQHCQEGCQCDDGLVLSGDQCVRPTGCGCLHDGRHRQGGENFWSDEQCQSYCVCNGTTGSVNCSASSCNAHEICNIVDGEHGCHPRTQATCSFSGDFQYTSFDGLTFEFQGNCKYILATVCNDSKGLPYFEVIGHNEPWFGISVNVSGHLILVSQNMYRRTEIDGVTRNLPVLLDSGSVSVYSSGPNTFISTDFNLSVSYDGSWVGSITLPKDYKGATCGLCGNFNDDSRDDFIMRSGASVSSVTEFGTSWKAENDTTCNDECGDFCQACKNQTRAKLMCEFIRDIHGPLSFCHATVDPQAYYSDCMFDVCTSGYSNEVLCYSVESYVSACHSANVMILPWRHSTSCNISCPVNSHYELCSTDCGQTLASSVDDICERSCKEGCFCDEGFVRSGGDCVPVEPSGCLYDGFYFHIGDQFWIEGCAQHCECFAPNDYRCSSASCTPTQECAVRNGRVGCYSLLSTCMVSGGPHYFTFDGAVAHFQGNCSYAIAQTCGNAKDRNLKFHVVATNMHRGSRTVSFVSSVDVWLNQGGQQRHISIGQSRRVKVDNKSMNSFPYEIDHLTGIYLEQNFVVINASSELLVYFDGIMTLVVRLGPSFIGSVCGMCGNNNRDPADDKTMPDGTPAIDDTAFGNSWKSDQSSKGCGAHDQTADPKDCPFRQDFIELCSIITNTSGPFQQCHVHINPEPYFASCIYDQCSYSDKNMLRSAVEAYELACTTIKVRVGCAEPECLNRIPISIPNPCEELNCTEDEWCGKRDGVYGCFCNDNHLRPNADSYDSKRFCQSSSANISLSRCQLFEAGFSLQNLHLSDARCKGRLDNGRLVFHFDNDKNICGTNLTADGTHFIYNNAIIGETDSREDTNTRNNLLELSFSCVYRLNQIITMDTKSNPFQSHVSKVIPNGEGMYQVRMIFYQDAGFSHPYTRRVRIYLGQRIYVAVHVDGVDSRQIATVIDSCWATPENDANSAVRWDLLINGCANPKDKSVKVTENGVSTTGSFSFTTFIFKRHSHKVFLHCNIRLCLLQSGNCATECAVQNGRLSRYSQMSTCMVSGGPHYFTFDGAVAHFQRTCSYTISRTCKNVIGSDLEFRVVATNKHHRSRPVSFVSAVDVWLNQGRQQRHISIGQSRRVKVDNKSMNSFPYEIDHIAKIYLEQNFVVINASSELLVYFDGIMTLVVRLGPSFIGSVCGMCGNNNRDPADDKTMPDGTPAIDDTAFGNSWKSDQSSKGCGAHDQTADPKDCPFRQDFIELCSIITNTSGPFQQCHVHINPEPYFASCIYDQCSYSDKNMLRSAVEAYELACTMINVRVGCAEPECLNRIPISIPNPCEELNCTEDEWCGKRDGVYGCFCNDNHLRPNADSYDSKRFCQSSSANISLSRCQLFEAGFSLQNLHLSDARCKGRLDNGRLVFHFDNDKNICGTNLTANGTHFIYNNAIIEETDSREDTNTRNNLLELSFSCVYRLSQIITMDTKSNPFQSRVSKVIPNGEGMYQVRMIFYQDAGFSHPYIRRVRIYLGQRIYVAVHVDGVDSRQIATVIDSCWATPENDANSAVRWDLLINGCANPKDKSMKVIKNGVSTTGSFSFNTFTFKRHSHKVFLHCNIRLCLLQSGNCATECAVQTRRLGRYSQMSTCMVSGGPHYFTFDGAVAHFQRTCSYTISRTCKNVIGSDLEFRVVATNKHHRSRPVSFVSAVDVWLNQGRQQRHISIGQSRRVKVDNKSMNSFPYEIDHIAKIYLEQNFVVINASSELLVYFDGIMTLVVRLGPSFIGSVCGMCGNNNRDPADDKTMPDGTPAIDDTAFGNSWKSDQSSKGCGAHDQTADPKDCPFRQDFIELCSIITNTSGPFQQCHVHINPEPYFASCIYDQCSYSDKNMLRSAVEAYELACTTIKVRVGCAEPECLNRIPISIPNPCEELNCTEDEWCGKRDGVYGCFCNDNHLRPNADSYDSKRFCQSSSANISLSRCQLFEAGFSLQNLHLSDARCKGRLDNGRLVFYFDNDKNICGTNLTANGTHFIYNNAIIGERDSTGDIINRNNLLELSFSCVYRLSQTITMDTKSNPIDSRVSKVIPNGEGMYQVRMIFYQDAGFSHPYTRRVRIYLGQRIYVAVHVDGVDSRQIATVIDSCWATPENDANSAVRWDLLINGCANPKDKSVKVTENGVSTTGSFSFTTFTFKRHSHKVFLHCNIRLCLLQSGNCAKSCFPGHEHHRVGRSVNVHDSTSISMGPFIWTSKK